MWEMTKGAARVKLTARAQVDQDTLEQLRQSAHAPEHDHSHEHGRRHRSRDRQDNR